MGMLAQFTNDRRQLYTSVDRIRWSPGRTGFTWYEPTNIGDAARRVVTESNQRLNSVRKPFFGAGTAGALAHAIEGLRDMPGRKAIALFSDGFSQSARGIIELANRFSVVIYKLDPRGLASFFLSAVDVCNSCGYIRTAEGEGRGVRPRSRVPGIAKKP